MFIGYTHNDEERHLVDFDDGCTRDAVGIDRTDAEAKAQADHEGCNVHTEACRFLNQMVGQALALTVHCNGECTLTDEQVHELLSPPCTEASMAGRRWLTAAEATR